MRVVCCRYTINCTRSILQVSYTLTGIIIVQSNSTQAVPVIQPTISAALTGAASWNNPNVPAPSYSMTCQPTLPQGTGQQEFTILPSGQQTCYFTATFLSSGGSSGSGDSSSGDSGGGSGAAAGLATLAGTVSAQVSTADTAYVSPPAEAAFDFSSAEVSEMGATASLVAYFETGPNTQQPYSVGGDQPQPGTVLNGSSVFQYIANFGSIESDKCGKFLQVRRAWWAGIHRVCAQQSRSVLHCGCSTTVVPSRIPGASWRGR